LSTRHGFRQHLWQKQHPIIANIATGTKVPMSATLHGYIGHISGALSLTLMIFFLKKLATLAVYNNCNVPTVR
jgi:uncharacterized membrane protein